MWEQITWYFNNHNSWAVVDAVIAVLSFIVIIKAFFYYISTAKNDRKYIIRKKNILKNNYILVCGLGENNRVYIDSEIQDGNKNIIIIEQDKGNLYI